MKMKIQITIILIAFVFLIVMFFQKDEPPISDNIPEKNKVSSLSNVDEIIKEMTIDEKIGQMVQPEQTQITSNDIKKYFIGSVLNGGGSNPGSTDEKAWLKFSNNYQDSAMDTRLKIPLLLGVDAVHGHNKVKNSIIFPHNIGLGTANDKELMDKIGQITAKEMLLTGHNFTFSPCVSVARDERWGRSYEAYSENQEIVTNLAIPFINGIQKYGISACAKHYICDGATIWGTSEANDKIDQGDSIISDEELNEIYLPVYRKAIENNVKCIMVSFSSVNGTKMHENKELIQDLLKDELGFKGFVLSDYNAIQQIQNMSYSEQVTTSINAGIDMLMEASIWRATIRAIKSGVENNIIPMERIDDAVKRILTAKKELGIFENPYGNTTLSNDKMRKPENIEIAKDSVRKSLVLLKNNDILPLKKNSKIFITGPAAENIGIQCGGWTIDWQGSPKKDLTTGTTIIDGFKTIAEKNNGQIITDEKLASNADIAVAVIGEKPYAEFHGDDEFLDLYNGLALSDNKKALDTINKLSIPKLVILVTGRPRILTNEINNWDGLVVAWLPGSEGEAIAEVLYGDYNFTGKLPFTWPKSLEQIPINDDNLNGKSGLFPLGYGLEMN